MKLRLTGFFLLATLLSFGQITKNQEWNFEKKVTFDDSVRITTGATSGYVLTSDTRGIATWQASGSGAILSSTTTISSAQLLALHTTPITLVAAQGANTFISVLAVIGFYDYNSIPYATDATLRTQYSDGTLINTNSNALSYSSDYLYRVYTSTISTSGSIAIINAGVQLTTPTSNPTAGNSTLKVTVLYTVVNL